MFFPFGKPRRPRTTLSRLRTVDPRARAEGARAERPDPEVVGITQLKTENATQPSLYALCRNPAGCESEDFTRSGRTVFDWGAAESKKACLRGAFLSLGIWIVGFPRPVWLVIGVVPILFALVWVWSQGRRYHYRCRRCGHEWIDWK